jgi:hypothetical protein
LHAFFLRKFVSKAEGFYIDQQKILFSIFLYSYQNLSSYSSDEIDLELKAHWCFTTLSEKLDLPIRVVCEKLIFTYLNAGLNAEQNDGSFILNSANCKFFIFLNYKRKKFVRK